MNTNFKLYDLLHVVNETPFTIQVYHDDFDYYHHALAYEESFHTKEEMQERIKSIEKYLPRCYIVIIEEK